MPSLQNLHEHVQKMENEFFTFNDFNGNEAVLYTDKGQIFIPNCIQISKIEIIEKTEKCFNFFSVILLQIKISLIVLKILLLSQSFIILRAKGLDQKVK